MAEDTSSDVRRLRVDKELWEAFGAVVGDGGRSAALKNYMQWQIEHPDTPLPGQFRVPVKVRRKPGPAEGD